MIKKIFGRMFIPGATGEYKLPILGYINVKIMNHFGSLVMKLANLESRILKRKMDSLQIDRPIYVTGIARGGTTIVLEMLSKHPEAESFRYMHMGQPFLPYLFTKYIKLWTEYIKILPPVDEIKTERLHKDRIKVSLDSPEALEEAVWEKFFDSLHDEKRSNVLDKETEHAEFEDFYKKHLKKLLLSRGRKRYLAKNNYAVTRLDYILKLFPDAKFLILVRDPVEHVASCIKQNRLFYKIDKENPRITNMVQFVGHHEFAEFLQCINVGRNGTVGRVRDLWSQGRDAEGWAMYWNSIYSFLADQIDNNRKVRDACLVVRYDDLCGNSAEIIDQIQEHTGLSKEGFDTIYEEYTKKLKKPTYYKPKFNEDEIAAIRKITNGTYSRFTRKRLLIDRTRSEDIASESIEQKTPVAIW